MRIVLAVAMTTAMAVGLGLPAPAAAQTPQAAVGPVSGQVDRSLPAASPRALALSRRYLELVQGEALSESLASSMQATMQATLPYGVPDSMLQAMDPWPVLRGILPEMMDRMAVMQAQVYSEAELQALVDFYDAPLGRTIVAKTPKLTPGMTAVMMEFMPRIQEGIRRRLCATEPEAPMCGSQPRR